MAKANYPLARRLIASLAIVAPLALAGCTATDDYYAAQRITADSNRTVASAQLASTQALSATLSTVTAQNAALVNTVTAQAAAWQIVVVILATGLVVSVVLAALIVASHRRPEPQAPIYVLPSPTNGSPILLDNPTPTEWPEQRARRRALRLEAPEARTRYQLTERTGR